MLRLRKQTGEEIGDEVLITVNVNIAVPADTVEAEIAALMNKITDSFDKMLPNASNWNEVTISSGWKLGAKN